MADSVGRKPAALGALTAAVVALVATVVVMVNGRADLDVLVSDDYWSFRKPLFANEVVRSGKALPPRRRRPPSVNGNPVRPMSPGWGSSSPTSPG
jgi:hypothetical protein